MVNTQTNTKTGQSSAKKKENQKSFAFFKKRSTKTNFVAQMSASRAKVTKSIKVGNNYNVKITALSSFSNSIVGLNEFTYGFPILIGGLDQANATLGDLVQVRVLKIQKKSNTTATKRNAVVNYAIAKVIKVVTKNNVSVASNTLGKTVEVNVVKKGPKGTFVASGFEANPKLKVIISSATALNLGQKVKVEITRLKENYALAKIAGTETQVISKKISSCFTQACVKQEKTTIGTKFSLILPKNAKNYYKKNLNMLVIRINLALKDKNQARINNKQLPTILFVKPIAGVSLGSKVQIQIVKAFTSKTANIVIGKIVEKNPISAANKKAIVQASIKKMLNSGMHFGEKAIQCNARMKNYIWTRKNVSKYALSYKASSSLRLTTSRADSSINKPLIQKGRNLINLFKTRRCLTKALAQVTKYAAKGKTFLFVGTKKAAAGLIARAALFSKKAFFVNTRWLGGMLTNWKTILKSISKIRPILKEKQVIIKDILQKRQNIRTLLMEKFFLLKNKSKLILKKGRLLLQKLLATPATAAGPSAIAKQFIVKRKEFVQKGQVLLEKRQLLLQKRKQVIAQSQSLYQKAVSIINNSISPVLAKATVLRQKLRELKALLVVSQQLQSLKQTAKAQNKEIVTVSYNAFTVYSKETDSNNSVNYVLPNPPKEILNKMILFINKIQTAETRSTTKKEASKENVLVLTKLLSQFSSFAPAIQQSIKALLANLQTIQTKFVGFQKALKVIIAKMQSLVTIKATIVAQLRQIEQSLNSQRNIIRIVKRKFKQILAQKRLIQFVPNLSFLPKRSTKIAQMVQVLMKKIVDPKLKYPIDFIYSPPSRLQNANTQSKKVSAMRKKKWQRLEKYLGGISNMTQINSSKQQIRNNVAIIIGQQEEMNAVRECQKLGIKMFHVVDTNCNPGFADHFIPANDDSRTSIQFILTQFLTRIRLAQKLKKSYKKKA